MSNFIRVKATRDSGKFSVFNEGNEFRMNDKIVFVQPGDLLKDLDRFIFIGSDDDIRTYARELLQLDECDYFQGDLFGTSELAKVIMNIQMGHVERCPEEFDKAKPTSLGFGYLRKDDTMGAASITFDSRTNNLSIVIVNYPLKAKSFNAANVNYFFSVKLANSILSEKADKFTVSERNLSRELKKALNHDGIHEIVDTIMKHRELITVTGTGGTSSLFSQKTRNTTINVPLLNSQDQSEKPISFKTISVQLAKNTAYVDALKPTVRKAAIIGATSLGIVCALFGAALIATGVLAPLGLTVLGLSAAVTSMILVGTAGFTVGGLFGGLFGGLVGTKIDATKANHIYKSLEARQPSGENTPGSSYDMMQNALEHPTILQPCPSSMIASENIDARYCGRAVCSSVEASVMEEEQRDGVRAGYQPQNSTRG